MKILTKEVIPQNNKPFPKLMISRDKTVIGLFISSSTGTILWTKSDGNIIGCSVIIGGIYNDYNGEITLSND